MGIFIVDMDYSVGYTLSGVRKAPIWCRASDFGLAMANDGFAGSSCAKAMEDKVFFDIATKWRRGENSNRQDAKVRRRAFLPRPVPPRLGSAETSQRDVPTAGEAGFTGSRLVKVGTFQVWVSGFGVWFSASMV